MGQVCRLQTGPLRPWGQFKLALGFSLETEPDPGSLYRTYGLEWALRFRLFFLGLPPLRPCTRQPSVLKNSKVYPAHLPRLPLCFLPAACRGLALPFPDSP